MREYGAIPHNNGVCAALCGRVALDIEAILCHAIQVGEAHALRRMMTRIHHFAGYDSPDILAAS